MAPIFHSPHHLLIAPRREVCGRSDENASQSTATSLTATFAGLLADLKAAYVETPALANELTAGLDAASAGDKTEVAAWTVVVNTLYNLDITKTRE